jgi:hypothetical protein
MPLVLPLLHWRIGGDTHNQYWARGQADDAFRDTTHEYMRQSRTSVCTHNDQVDIGCVGRISVEVRDRPIQTATL